MHGLTNKFRVLVYSMAGLLSHGDGIVDAMSVRNFRGLELIVDGAVSDVAWSCALTLCTRLFGVPLRNTRVDTATGGNVGLAPTAALVVLDGLLKNNKENGEAWQQFDALSGWGFLWLMEPLRGL